MLSLPPPPTTDLYVIYMYMYVLIGTLAVGRVWNVAA